MEPKDAVRAYGEAWGDVSEAQRRELLDASWADGGVYCDPLTTVTGRRAVEQHIADFADRLPGHTIVVTTGVDSHDGFARFGWEIRQPDGAVLSEGMDFVAFAADGRISRVIGFFGPLPPRD